MSYLTDEIASQPECWAEAIEVAASAGPALPKSGERVAVIGCGSSLNVARCYAALREAAGHGVTDAFPASEVPATRRYDHMVLISRTGTTTEVLDALGRARPGLRTTAVSADPGSPLVRQATAAVLLDFSAERSVVSSRFITSAIVLLRAHLGADLRALPDAAARELARPLPPGLADRTEFTFLGRGWAAAVADEAALKLREAARTWAESYPALEYRHGPISVSDASTVVWALGQVPPSLLADARRTGAMVIAPARRPADRADRRPAARRRAGRAQGHRPGPAACPVTFCHPGLMVPGPESESASRSGPDQAAHADRLLAGGRIVTPEGVLSPGWIRLAGDVIDAVGTGDPRGQRAGLAAADLRGAWVLPGFVDMHVHGGGGTSFTEGTAEQARQAAEFHRRHGSTSLVASLVTAPLATLEQGPPCWPAWPTRASSPGFTWKGRSWPRPGAARRTRGTCSPLTWPSSSACTTRPGATFGSSRWLPNCPGRPRSSRRQRGRA